MKAGFSCIMALCWAASCAAAGGSAVRALGDAFAGVYDKVAPGVVVLEVSRAGADAGNFNWQSLLGNGTEPEPDESEGSGFVIDPAGYILTNAHVIEGADPKTGIVARLKDGSRLPLTLVGVDDKTDLAVLKADATGLPAVAWGDSEKLRVGEFVCGIGAPFELDYTLTVGVVSAKGRSDLTETVYEDYIQTDAAINPGNSGGPLVDLDGKAVGVITLINGLNRGLGFAIPAKLAQTVSRDLIENGRVTRPWLGIRIETLSSQPDLQKMLGVEKGVVVREIFANTPAARSELQPADVIVDVDGQTVATARDLQRTILGKKIGQEVKLRVWSRQNSNYRTVSVKAEELPDEPARTISSRSAPFRPPAPDDDASGDPFAAFGLQVQNLPKEMAQQMAVSSAGVIVTNVEPGSPADMAGLQRRDVITAVGDDAVTDKESLAAGLAKISGGEGVVLLLERKGKETYAILKQ